MKKKERINYEMKEFRAEDREGSDLPDLIGHAAVFDVEVEIGGYFGSFMESVAPGAFKKSIGEDDVRALFNHDPNQVLGRTASGTLELKEDKIGLLTRISPPNTQLGRDVTELVRRGDVSQMSFGFFVIKEEIEEERDKPLKRRILEAELFDVSPVTFPAFDTTDIAVSRNFRSDQDIFEDIQGRLKQRNDSLKALQMAAQHRVSYRRFKIRA